MIRTETPADKAAVYAVEAAAFGRPDEANLVDNLREQGAITLSLVFEVAGQIAGHVVFSPITHDEHPFTSLGMGPVAVLPAYQNQGIGSALIRRGLEMCREQGHSLVFVLGSPDYYPRFGFRPAVPLGFTSAYTSDEGTNPHFMVLELVPGAATGKGGFVRYHPVFDGV